MKFGKLIQALVDKTWPEWKDNYLAYNSLKKRLKLLVRCILSRMKKKPRLSENRSNFLLFPVRLESGVPKKNAGNSIWMRREKGVYRRQILPLRFAFRRLEAYFKRLLLNELRKLNRFYLEKEQEYVIRLQNFKERIDQHAKKCSSQPDDRLEMLNLRKDFVILHGEMVLLKTYSSLNYTGLLKIVKKHDRMTGAWLRLSFIPKLSTQPFYATDVLSSLLLDCENNFMNLFPTDSSNAAIEEEEYGKGSDHLQEEFLNQEEVMKGMHRSTVAALQTVRDMRRGSSSYNPFSVPPYGPANSENLLGSVIDEDIESDMSSPSVSRSLF